MASLSDLASVYSTSGQPAGFALAGLGLQQDAGQASAETTFRRTDRNFGERYLPDMLNSQASRGAYHTSATGEKYRRLREDVGDSLVDLADSAGKSVAQLSTNALLAQTGIRI